MEENTIILSICIPTNGAIQWVISSIESIFSQGCDNHLFEVVITDNGENDDLGKILGKYSYPNLRYIKTSAPGFENQIYAFKAGRGEYIKMINHRSRIMSGYLQRLIDFICGNMEVKPSLYFSNGHLGNESLIECDCFETFIRRVSFWTSWEEGVGFWQTDLPKLGEIKFDKMFPAASILFSIREESKFVIWNEVYSYQPKSDRVRNYDFFEVFAVGFLDMINDLRRTKRISINTFNYVRRDMFRRYLVGYYYQIVVKKTDKSIPLHNIAENMSVYYSFFDYLWMNLYGNTVMRVKGSL